tara:strand:- start:34693 stop:35592 length:900 start_codon:yes stop_codon:yes gene_type:complete
MTVAKMFGLRRTCNADVGIEIEVEGKRLPYDRVSSTYWHVEGDGSLRGDGLENACEFVLAEPMSLGKAKDALVHLDDCYEKNKSVVNDSPRAGVHIHVNCQNLSLLELYNFITAYLIFENCLVSFCGPDREGNLFCLRAKDAEYLIYSLCRALETGSYRRTLCTDELRYASMNVRALGSYGSLEFRAMRGTRDMGRIALWAEILVNLRDRSVSFQNPVEMIMESSEGGFEALAEKLFGEHASVIYAQPDWQAKAVEGMRRAQEVAFSGDWEEIASLPKRQVGGVTVTEDWDDDFPPIDF